MNKLITPILRVIISLGLIIILLYIMRDKYDQILAVLKGTKVAFFGLALVVFTLALTLATFRLNLIIRAQCIYISFLEALSLTFIGYFFNNFLPTAIGGDVVKGYYLSKKSNVATGSFTAIFVDRAIGLITMIFMAFFALFFVKSQIIDENVRRMVYLITAISFVAIALLMNKGFAKRIFALLFFLKPLEESLKKIYTAVSMYKDKKLLMLGSFLISIMSQLLFFSAIGVVALSIGSVIPFNEILLRMPVVGAMSLLPSINGLGVREGTTVLFFGPFIGKENAFAVSILWFFMLLIVSLAGGIIYLVSPQFKMKFPSASCGEFRRT